MPEHKHSRSAQDCEKAGVPVAGLTAEYSEEQAAAFYAGVMARAENDPDSKAVVPEDIELRVPYQRGYAYADSNLPGIAASVYGQSHQPTEQETVDDPPEGLRIDQAQRGGSSRGNEENTNPHPSSPGSDRQTGREHKNKPAPTSGRQHAGSQGDAQATKQERERSEETRRAGK